jgi:hypothetical protein
MVIKMESLQKDVIHCLQSQLAPMPAIPWCFSCIDLLGSLYAAWAAHKGTTERSRKYMEELMNYTSEQAEGLRHKLVHLADPQFRRIKTRKLFGNIIMNILSLSHPLVILSVVSTMDHFVVFLI